MAQVELSNVTFCYGDRPALQDISVGFSRDRVTAIMGRSGSGKSTLLQVVMGLIRPQAGDVKIDGIPHGYPLSARQRFRFGYVIQGNGLFPHLTVAENIALPGRITNIRR